MCVSVVESKNQFYSQILPLSLHFLLIWWHSRLWLCWTSPDGWFFFSLQSLNSVPVLLIHEKGQAVVLPRLFYWPLLGSTCSPLKSRGLLTAWQIHTVFESSAWWEKHFTWDMNGNLLCCREQSLDVQSFKRWNPQDPIQRRYLSTPVFGRSCGAEMWWALVRSVRLCERWKCCTRMLRQKGPRCGCCSRKEVVSD